MKKPVRMPQSLSEYIAILAEVRAIRDHGQTGDVRYLAERLLREMPTEEEAGRWFDGNEANSAAIVAAQPRA